MASSMVEQAEQEEERMLNEEEQEDGGHRHRRSHRGRRIEEGEAQEQEVMLSWPASSRINRAQEAGVVRLLLAKEKAPRREAENKEAEQQLLTMILETTKMQQASSRKVLEIQEETGNRK